VKATVVTLRSTTAPDAQRSGVPGQTGMM
jgi:hypothetical protein